MKRKILVNVVGVLLAFLLGALVMLFQGYNPLETTCACSSIHWLPGRSCTPWAMLCPSF